MRFSVIVKLAIELVILTNQFIPLGINLCRGRGVRHGNVRDLDAETLPEILDGMIEGIDKTNHNVISAKHIKRESQVSRRKLLYSFDVIVIQLPDLAIMELHAAIGLAATIQVSEIEALSAEMSMQAMSRGLPYVRAEGPHSLNGVPQNDEV